MKIIFNENKKIRIDKWLADKFPEKSREFFNENIKNDNILLNHLPTKPSTILKINDEIQLSDIVFEKTMPKKLFQNKELKINIIFENDDFMVVDKPAGMLTHPTTKNEKDTLVNGIIFLKPEIIKVGDNINRPGIVHRLDKETSGLLIIAKNNKSFKYFKKLFANKKINKVYTALIYGHLKKEAGIISLPIEKSKNKFNRRKISFNDLNSKPAITEYKVIKVFKNSSLIEAMPKTGRTHQIRVHFASMSNFILGDKEYGSKKINQSLNINRHFLHASKISFDFLNKFYSFTSKLPKDLTIFLKNWE